MIENQIIEESDNAFSTPQIDEQLRQFLNENADENHQTVYTLYRRLRPGSGKKFAWIKKFWDVPDIEYIADTWGPDDYRVVFTYYDKQQKKHKCSSINFTVDAAYNADTIQASGNNFQASAGNNNAVQLSGIMQTVMQQQQNMMIQFMQMITGLMQGVSKNDTGGNFEAMTKQMSNVLMNSFRQQQELIQEMGRAQLIQSNQLPAPVEKDPPDWVGTIIDLWERFGKPLLQAPKGFQQLAAQSIQNDPQFQQLISSPENFQIAYEALTGKYGAENVDNMLNILNINPAEYLENVAGE